MKMRHILVMQPWLHPLAHEILYGANDYLLETGAIHMEVSRTTWDWAMIEKIGSRWACDGLIAPITDEHNYQIVKGLRWRCVNTYGSIKWPGIPNVDINHYATGSMAAEHLLGLGYESFAYVGSNSLLALTERRDGFVDAVRLRGFESAIFEHGLTLYIEGPAAALWKKRLAELKKPCAIYCSDDHTARTVATYARSMGLRIPDDLTLMGTQNDEGLCFGMNPPLTSIHLPYRQVGYEAARMLVTWAKSGQRPTDVPPLKPSHVEIRASTQALAVDDENLRKAIRYLREHYTEKVSMTEVARSAGLSLRNLQRRFAQRLGHNPQTELHRIRIQRVKELLRETNVTLEDIASQTGYPSANYLCEHFRRQTDETPGEYRKRTRLAS